MTANDRPPDRAPGEFEDSLAALGLLADPARRSLYVYVIAQPHDVSRTEAADATGLQRSLTAFHLDKLVEAGLLDATYRRLTGRSGPGAGRPSKLYRRASTEHAVSVPPRNYALAAELLAEAVAEAGRRSPRSVLGDVARRFGRRLGIEVRSTIDRRAGRRRRQEAISDALGRCGYQPYREGDDVRLRNCPFHALAERHRDLVCSMNLALLEGVLDGSGSTGLRARLEPRDNQCCVAIGPAEGPAAG